MPTYTAPVEDMIFLFEKLRNNKNYNEIKKYEEVTPELVKNILEEFVYSVDTPLDLEEVTVSKKSWIAYKKLKEAFKARKSIIAYAVKANSNLEAAYGKNGEERHRHRYEANPAYRTKLEKAGMIISGRSEEGLVEAVELKDHPWFVAVQFHPEFTNRLQNPNKIIKKFVEKSLELKK